MCKIKRRKEIYIVWKGAVNMVVEDKKKLPKDFPFTIEAYQEKKSTVCKAEVPHRHKFFEITYVESGSAEYLVDEHRYVVETGDLILFNHKEEHCWRGLSGKLELQVLMFSSEVVTDGSHVMDTEYLIPFLERGEKFQNRISGKNREVKKIKQILDEIQKEAEEQKTGNKLMIKADILKILTILVRYYEGMEETLTFVNRKKGGVRRIEKAFEFVKQNYDRKVTLEETAATVCMSPNYFSAYFKKTAGCSFQEYLTKIRMEKAKELLRYSDDGILGIAQECGVPNPANFYRLYKKYFGIAPGEERNQKAIS